LKKATWDKLLVALSNETLQVSLFAPLKTMVDRVKDSLDLNEIYNLLVSNMNCFELKIY
jgi:hypothetical protein